MLKITKTMWGSAVFVAALLWIFGSTALGQNGRTAQSADEFTVTVLPEDNRPVLEGASDYDLGGLSFTGAESQRHGNHGQTKSFSITRRVRLQVRRKSGVAGIVTVSAFLVRSCDPCKLRLDGVELKSGPTIVLQRAQLNSATDHRLEIEIPASMAAGAVEAEIGWQVDDK